MGKKTTFFLFVTALLTFFSICKEYDVFHFRIKRLKKLEKDKLEQKDHNFVLIIPSYNCSGVIEKIFKSIRNQTYKNYRVIFIDDGSADDSYRRALELKNPIQDHKFTVLRNPHHLGSTECLYELAQECKDEEVIVFFEGNCWLKDDNTLELFNEYYKRYDIWLAYSQHANSRTNEKGDCKFVVSTNFFSNSMRRKPWAHAKLKTFYAALFKKVPLYDFFYRGKFIHEAMDCAYMFSMMEMAGGHVAFLPDIHCLFVQKTSSDDTRPSCLSKFKCYQDILRREPFDPLSELQFHKALSQKKADLLIFSYDRPLQLYALLESIYKNMKNYKDIAVLYRTSNKAFFDAYEELKITFADVLFFKQKSKNPAKNFKSSMIKVLNRLSSDHIIFSVDDMVVKQEVDLSEPIQKMEETSAYFFSLRLGTHIRYCYMGEYNQYIPKHVKVKDNIIAWQIDAARGDWNYYPSVDMTIFSKKHIMSIFPKISCRNPYELEPAWENHYRRTKKAEMRRQIGLCYLNSKALNIPLNVVCSPNKNMNLFSKEELLEKFEQGLKIDIDPLQNALNAAVHIELEPTFIERKLN